MPRSTASIDAEIAVIEARLAASANGSMSGDGVAASTELATLHKRLDFLYRMKDRASGAAPMFVRGVVKGL